MKQLNLTSLDIEKASKSLVKKLRKFKLKKKKTLVVGIGRGGLIPAQYVAYGLGIRDIAIIQSKLYNGTEKGSEARAVFGGTVTSVILSKGGAKTVIIQHGNYYTVYSNLSKIYVKKGEKVKIKQKLGMVYTNSRTGATVLKFQLWFDKNEQNPASWIYKM